MSGITRVLMILRRKTHSDEVDCCCKGDRDLQVSHSPLCAWVTFGAFLQMLPISWASALTAIRCAPCSLTAWHNEQKCCAKKNQTLNTRT